MARPPGAARLLAATVAIVMVAGCTGTPGGPRSAPPATFPPSIVGAGAWARGDAATLGLGGGPTSTLAAVLAPQEVDGSWLIAGTRLAVDGATTATAWTSVDALHWRSTALAGSDGRVLAATTWGDRTVLVGSVRHAGRTRAAAWISPGAGQPFALVPPDAGLRATAEPGPSGSTVTGSASMDAVAAGAQGIFAAGSVSGRQAMWYSTDGTNWVRITGAERLIDSSAGAQVTSMLVTTGGVTAAGTVADGTFTDAALWTSSDGINWRRSPAPGPPFGSAGDHRIDGLAVNASGLLVAVGAVRSGPTWTPASWVSPGGGQWSQASEALPSTPRPQPGSGAVVRAVTSTGTGLSAVGGSATAQSVWTSSDGLDWTATPLPAAESDSPAWSADLVATDGPTTMVVDAATGQPRVLVQRAGTWIDESADPLVFGPVAPVATPAGLVADGDRLLLAVDVVRSGSSIADPDTSSTTVLESTDGVHWRRLDRGDAFVGARVDDLTVVGGSVVAVGTTHGPRGTPAATVWTSPTGRRWRVAASWSGSTAAPRQATSAAALGRRAVAVGAGPLAVDAGVDAADDAQAWVGSTGTWTAEGALDATTPSVDDEEPLGSCSDGRTVIAVGAGTRRGVPRSPLGRSTTATGPAPASTTAATATATATTLPATGSPAGPDGQGDDGVVALAWTTTDGTAWTAGTVTPASGAGGDESMDGCAAVGTGWIAWGQTPGGDGLPAPAIWSSADGTVWTLRRTPTLTVPGSSPLTDLVRVGRSWFATSGGGLAASVATADPTAADPDLPAVTPPASSGPDGSAGIWTSRDGGTTWARLDTSGPAWASAETLDTDLVATVGGRIVVAGSSDGRLTTWSGRLSTSATVSGN